MKKLFLLLAVFIVIKAKAQVPCTLTNSPVFQATTSQATLATNGICGMHIIINNAVTSPTPGGPVSYAIVVPSVPTVTLIMPSSTYYVSAGIYTVLVMDNTNLCVTSQTVEVIVLSAPIITLTPSNPFVCSGSATTLTASGANSYTWNTNSTSTSISVMPSSAKIYSVIGTGTNVCANTASTIVNVKALPNITLAADQNSICANEPITLSASGANTYTWSSLQTGPSITITPAFSSYYEISGTDEFGCEASAQIYVSVLPCTAIEKLRNENVMIKIYPNPANDFIELNISNFNLLKDFHLISIYNNLGQLVREEEVSFETKGFSIKTSDLENGVYFLNLKSNNLGIVSKRFVVSR